MNKYVIIIKNNERFLRFLSLNYNIMISYIEHAWCSKIRMFWSLYWL